MKVLIFSNRKGNVWWKSNFAGYTSDLHYAGIYEYEDVVKKYPKFTFDDTTDDYMVRISEEDANFIIEERNLLESIEKSILNISKNKKELASIERELGIDLILFYSIIKEGKAWYLDHNKKPRRMYFYDLPQLNRKDKYIVGTIESSAYDEYQKFYFKDYGKLWSMNKEELLNVDRN